MSEIRNLVDEVQSLDKELTPISIDSATKEHLELMLSVAYTKGVSSSDVQILNDLHRHNGAPTSLEPTDYNPIRSMFGTHQYTTHLKTLLRRYY